MRKILLLWITGLVFLGCQTKENFELQGEAKGYEDGTKVLVQSFSFKNNFPATIDTLVVEDGKFSKTYGVSKKPEMNILRVENEQFSVIYFPEKSNLHAVLNKTNPKESRVEGGKQNKMYNEFVEKNNEFAEKRQSLMMQFQQAQQEGDTEVIPLLQSRQLNLREEEVAFRKNWLKSNPKSLFGIMVLSGMIDNKEINPAEASEYLESLDQELAQMPNVEQLKSKLEQMKKAAIGSKAPEFSGPTPEGKTLALSDALGKYTIIDFWASWCMPCRKENPNLVKAYKKYHHKGLNIIGVSLDKEREPWLKAIEDDGLDWFQISHLQFWNDPIIGDYNIKAIPAAFLLDENGVIIDKDVRGEALQVKLASLFGEEE